MRKIYIISLLIFAKSLVAQLSTSENYIYTKKCLSADCSKKSEVVEYLDGLGRTKQIINIKGSPSSRDIVLPVEYDEYGRNVKNYLPIPQQGTANGAIYSNPTSAASQTYGNDTNYYSHTLLENAPIKRVISETKPGSDWQSHPATFDYQMNQSSEVRKFKVTSNLLNGIIVNDVEPDGTYPAGSIIKNSVTDEDGNKTLEFVNGKGEKILSRSQVTGTSYADTYYIYNKYGQLAVVLPPLASVSTNISGDVLNNLAYQYRYDTKNRLAEKKLPGKSWEWIVYDKRDRVVASKEGQNNWVFTKYDIFDRAVYSGTLASANTREELQNQANTFPVANISEKRTSASFSLSGIQVYYSNTAFPTNIDQVLAVNYYDTYPPASPSLPATIMGQPVATDQNTVSDFSTKTFTTAKFVKNLQDDNWTKDFYWYDSEGRMIGNQTVNHLGGSTKTESLVDFSGVILQSTVYHKRLSSDQDVIVTQNFEYNHQNSLLKQWHKVGSQQAVLLAEYQYNELNQPASKKVGNNLQEIIYQYDIRGSLVKINDVSNLGTKLFAYELKYHNPSNTAYGTGKYSGSISQIDWRSAQDNILRRYNYQYDSLNRLSAATYSEPNSSIPQNNFYNEAYSYDLNGNITTLSRNSKGFNGFAQQIDDLSYNYNYNRLNSVIDVSNNYSGYSGTGIAITYDDNGNMISMPDKGITEIQYNILNLPAKLQYNDYVIQRGNKQYVNLSYGYRADGTKISKSHTYRDFIITSTLSTRTVEYLDGFQYQGLVSAGSGVTAPILQFFPTAEGYYDFENNRYIYQYKDHLGNIRLSYYDNGGAAAIMEESNYYPFGLKHEGYNDMYGNAAYSYRYNGKELQESGMYVMDWRHYMPDVGRFIGMDALSAVYESQTPYHFALNSPTNYSDPTGLYTVAPNGSFNTSQQGEIRDLQNYFGTGGSVLGLDLYVRNNPNFVQEIYVEELVITGRKSEGFGEGKYNSAVLFSGIKKMQREWNLSQTRIGWSEMVRNCEACKEIEAFQQFLFMDVPLMVTGYGALGSIGGRVLGHSIGGYLQGAMVRGSIDYYTQDLFNNGEVNYRQVGINAMVGIGGNNYGLMSKVGVANVILNTANNYYTSDLRNNFESEKGINALKIVTGVLGNSIGNVGGNFLGSIYGNGLDAYLNSTIKSK